MGIIRTCTFESHVSFGWNPCRFLGFLFRKGCLAKPLLSAVFRARRGCPFCRGAMRAPARFSAGWRVYVDLRVGAEVRQCTYQEVTEARRTVAGVLGLPGVRAVSAALGDRLSRRPLPYNRRCSSRQAAEGHDPAMMCRWVSSASRRFSIMPASRFVHRGCRTGASPPMRLCGLEGRRVPTCTRQRQADYFQSSAHHQQSGSDIFHDRTEARPGDVPYKPLFPVNMR